MHIADIHAHLVEAVGGIANASSLATEAARVLSQVAKNNSWFQVTTSNAGASVKLTEKLVNRPYNNDMVGTTAATSDADPIRSG